MIDISGLSYHIGKRAIFEDASTYCRIIYEQSCNSIRKTQSISKTANIGQTVPKKLSCSIV
jgi:hypothetical protein